MAAETETYNVEVIEGRKYVHYNGYTFEGAEDVPGKPWRAVEFRWLYVDVAETLAKRKSIADACKELSERRVQDWHDLTEAEAADYSAGATRLALDEVTEETPCGSYFC